MSNWGTVSALVTADAAAAVGRTSIPNFKPTSAMRPLVVAVGLKLSVEALAGMSYWSERTTLVLDEPPEDAA